MNENNNKPKTELTAKGISLEFSEIFQNNYPKTPLYSLMTDLEGKIEQYLQQGLKAQGGLDKAAVLSVMTTYFEMLHEPEVCAYRIEESNIHKLAEAICQLSPEKSEEDRNFLSEIHALKYSNSMFYELGKELCKEIALPEFFTKAKEITERAKQMILSSPTKPVDVEVADILRIANSIICDLYNHGETDFNVDKWHADYKKIIITKSFLPNKEVERLKEELKNANDCVTVIKETCDNYKADLKTVNESSVKVLKMIKDLEGKLRSQTITPETLAEALPSDDEVNLQMDIIAREKNHNFNKQYHGAYLMQEWYTGIAGHTDF